MGDTNPMVNCANSFFKTLTASVHGGVDARELAEYGVNPAEVIDFSANQSPLGPSPRVAAAVAQATVDQYPDREARPLARAIAEYHHLAPEQVVVGNGSTELIRLIAQLALRENDTAMGVKSTFGEYSVATKLTHADYIHIVPGPSGLDGMLRRGIRPALFWWCSPNNPTGEAPEPEEITKLVLRYPHILFVLDEAYCDLLPRPQWSPELLAVGNLIILRSMTKAWGLAGLRLGYALGCPELMNPLRAAKPPWNVNACAQAAGLAALADRGHHDRTVSLLREQKEYLVQGLNALGWKTLPSAAAFFLVRVGDAAAIRRALLAQGCLVRDCTSFGLPEYIRVSPRLPEQNLRLLVAFDNLPAEAGMMKVSAPRRPR